MQKALVLAKKGQYTARPNPVVGCVIVKAGQQVGAGCHWQAGKPHAEVEALQEAGGAARGATCYVTLEPCVHQGKTGPCVQALVQAGIARVVVAMRDPNPLVAGKGLAVLKAAGIRVEEGVLAVEAARLNLGFVSRMLRARPFTWIKVGMSLDGKIAMHSGESRWITSEPARKQVHAWRARMGAVMTTASTVKRDQARLTVRGIDFSYLPQGVTFVPPLKVLIESSREKVAREACFFEEGTIWVPPLQKGYVKLNEVLSGLHEREVNDLLIEAGGRFVGQWLANQWADALLIYMAPKILGIKADSFANVDLPTLSSHIKGDFASVAQVGPDLCMTVLLSDFARKWYGVT